MLGVSGTGEVSGARKVAATAAALCSTTVITASLGFVFWALAARLTTPEVVGRSAAVISSIEFIATFATLGLHTLLIAELPRRDGAARRSLGVACVGVSGAMGFSVALAFGVLHHVLSPAESMYASTQSMALFGIGAAVSTVTIVFDGALIGVARSGQQVLRNLLFAVAKLVGLPLAGFAVGLSPQAIVSVWVIGNVLSLVVIAVRAGAFRRSRGETEAMGGLPRIWRTAAGHHWVNVATQAPRLALPILVASQLGSEANAGFYAALLMISFIWIIPNHLGVAMFALHSGDSQHFSTGLETALRLSALVSVGAAIGGPLLAYPLLSIFGPAYVQAQYCFAALAVCTFAGAVKAIYIAVRRSQGELGRAAGAAVAGAVWELSAAEAGLLIGGVTGVGVALGAAAAVEAAFLWPVIARARQRGGMPAAAVPEGELSVEVISGGNSGKRHTPD